jgi:hypothetical protein
MNNQLLEVLKKSMHAYSVHGERSNKKLFPLHHFFAKEVLDKLNSFDPSIQYTVKSYGVADDKEGKISGRYYPKNVDITFYDRDKVAIAGIAVKFIVSNYSQNSNNVFENMLGETANIRSNNIPYYQVLILPEKLPYFKNGGNLEKIETITESNMKKYINLSNDNVDVYYHTPNKTFLGLVTNDVNIDSAGTKSEYRDLFGKNNIKWHYSEENFEFDDSVIYNDVDKFIDKVAHSIAGR